MEETKKVYSVNIKRTEWGRIEVEAKSKGEALAKAEEEYHNGNVEWGKENAEYGVADPV